jgi:site-specific DNA-methyltransferase (adenine-specific)
MIDLRLGNCLEVLKDLEDNSIDSIVTDPPYGLSFMGKKWDYKVPSIEIWKECLRVLKPGGHLLSFSGSRTYHRIAVNIEDAGFEIRDQIMWVYAQGFPKSQTALKPAHEPIVVARKPLSEKTLAKNVLKWGTGGMNIDESRVEFEDTQNAATNPKYRKENNYKMPEPGQVSNGAVNFTSSKNEYNTEGRWPANVILDEEAGKILDEQSGYKTGQRGIVKGDEPSHTKKNNIYNDYSMVEGKYAEPKDSLGGASRFFYSPKVSPKERNMGLDGIKNTHITVKPIKLMEYLINLVTPKEGVVLDLFMGSGSTGIAAKNKGFNFIGIEMEFDYFNIAKERIKNNKE